MITCKKCGGTDGVHAHLVDLGFYCDYCCPLCRYVGDYDDMDRVEASDYETKKTACGRTEMCSKCADAGGCDKSGSCGGK